MFKTYDENGQVLFDSQKSIFSFVKSGRLTRLLDKTFQNNKREVWYRAKRLGINSKMRQRWADIYTPEYCMYYIDVDNPISPIASVYYDGLTKDCNPVVHLNTGFFDGKARMMFYSNGRLSDEELAKFQIYIFDNRTEKETIAGLNTYDKQGKLTFSSRSMPMDIEITLGQYQPSREVVTEYEKATRDKADAEHWFARVPDVHKGVFFHKLEVAIQKLNEITTNQLPALMNALGATKITGKDSYLIPKSKKQAGLRDVIIGNDTFIIVCLGCKDGLILATLPTFNHVPTNGAYKVPEIRIWDFQKQRYFIKAVNIDNLPFPYN